MLFKWIPKLIAESEDKNMTSFYAISLDHKADCRKWGNWKILFMLFCSHTDGKRINHTHTMRSKENIFFIPTFELVGGGEGGGGRGGGGTGKLAACPKM